MEAATTMTQPGGGPVTTTRLECLVRPTTSGTCRYCGAAIHWVTKRDGIPLPVNDAPLTMWREGDSDDEALVVEGVPHWVTCTRRR